MHNRIRFASLLTIVLLSVLALLPSRRGDAVAPPRGTDGRLPWTASRIKGTPEPPNPYRVGRAFPNLTFAKPLLMTRLPGTKRLLVAEQAGKVYSFPNDQASDRTDLFIDVRGLNSWDKSQVENVRAIYGLAFHPRFAINRYCYVCYVLKGRRGELADGTRVSRFKVGTTNPPRIDPASEKVIITWQGGGHNGGDLHFGADGFLYISTGDATPPVPPDARNTGQDISDLPASILRIDVDRTEDGKPYAIPADNPFVRTPGARGEVWAFGFRNPWRMSFDHKTGDLWVGDVGWELWEMVYRVKKGGNYGWSVMEGRQPVKPNGKVGPTPILPPDIEFPHNEAASITGGYVYHGKRLPDLAGQYICGDYVTHKLWAVTFDSKRILSRKEIAQGTEWVVSFGEDHEGELYFLDHQGGTVHHLVPNPAASVKQPPFPRTLSQTGLFTSTKGRVPAAGVVPFAVNAPMWADHATAERFVALPGTSPVTLYDSPVPIPGSYYKAEAFFPTDGVLAKTLLLETEAGSRRPIETQVLHYDGTDWRGYSYAWNDAQTDATLVPVEGMDRTFTVKDASAPGGRRQQTWHYPSRTECLTCHNARSAAPLAFTLAQLDERQLQEFERTSLVRLAPGEKDRPVLRLPASLTDPYDQTAPIEARARSYLHVNCSHCHQRGAGGTATIDLRHGLPLARMQCVDVPPGQGAFEVPKANIIAGGDPYRSVLFYRMAKLGAGRMPHLGSGIVDVPGLRLMHDWIRHLPGTGAVARDERLRELGSKDRRVAVDRLLSSTTTALLLAHALGDGRLGEPARAEAVAAGLARTDSHIRDLFERFVPEEKRIKRLGSVVRPEAVLALKGDVARGRELFVRSTTLQCANCHRVGDTGRAVGPDLTQIGKKVNRKEILESLLYPSRKVEPAYVTYSVETTSGQVHTGILVRRDKTEVVLKLADAQDLRLPMTKVERLVPQLTSLMPDLLLRDLTAQQAADLVDYLASLK